MAGTGVWGAHAGQRSAALQSAAWDSMPHHTSAQHSAPQHTPGDSASCPCRRRTYSLSRCSWCPQLGLMCTFGTTSRSRRCKSRHSIWYSSMHCSNTRKEQQQWQLWSSSTRDGVHHAICSSARGSWRRVIALAHLSCSSLQQEKACEALCTVKEQHA